jgi:hypothetical protein
MKAAVVQCPPRCSFASLEGALYKLATARYLEQKQEDKTFNALCKGDSLAPFFALGPEIVIACVRRKDAGMFISPRAVWDDRMNVVLKFETIVPKSWRKQEHAQTHKKTIRATGRAVLNQTPMKCEIVVLWTEFLSKSMILLKCLVGKQRRRNSAVYLSKSTTDWRFDLLQRSTTKVY